MKRFRKRTKNRGIAGGRPASSRQVNFNPRVTYFKPRRVPVGELKVSELTREELEALRLKDVKDLSQEECADKMKTSQSTFQRILKSARQKVSTALVKGQAISIINEE